MQLNRSLLTCTFLLFCAGLCDAQVRRSEAIKIAESYLNLRWQGTLVNVLHGLDVDGIHVETPDASFSRPGIRPGWWRPGRSNVGMPYMWGGFSTPEEFTADLKMGRYAGDVYTAEKRRLGVAAVSRRAVGIDCSGLISRCWKLERAYSTKELPNLCIPLASTAKLQAGDILNSPDNHVLLFKEWTDASRQRLLAYEAGSPPTWKVLLNSIPLSMLQEQDYQPMTYRRIRN